MKHLSALSLPISSLAFVVLAKYLHMVLKYIAISCLICEITSKIVKGLELLNSGLEAE